ncbi:hypothetical protein FCG77_006440 [Klebsiella pneumoniae]|nr:hypothetical protein FCG79_002395 [Klebsiella pneumoniae]TYX58699.1 hypothetical protein FCG77_006440 [Klebsiella pneumoniae]TYX68898.1 hypothetical protein FCG82_007905 [Klebsiella pneumoniae]TYY13796.1 hypothetical protein FCH03_003640 [Klebsiella pneumoniae]TYY69658.1 hypothetical protein FCH01_003430 [Klebsiella pneumoniae]
MSSQHGCQRSSKTHYLQPTLAHQQARQINVMNTCKKITNKLVTVINNRISSAGKYKVSVCDASGILGHYAGR